MTDQFSTEQIDEDTTLAGDSQPAMKEPKQYRFIKDEMLIVAMQAGGINEVCISRAKNDDFYYVSVLYKQTGERHYITTRRIPDKPRKFKHVDVAIKIIYKLIGATKFIVDIEANEHP